MQKTSAAFIEQLVYFDNFMFNNETPNPDLDGQLSLDLAVFADESFIFADEEKPDPPNMSDFEGENERNENLNEAHYRQLKNSEGNIEHNSEQTIAANQGLQNTGDFINVDVLQTSAPSANDDYCLGFHEAQGSSSLALSESWYHVNNGETKNDNVPPRLPEGHQLHSLLNNKIEATKSSKFYNRVGHGNLNPGGLKRTPEQASCDQTRDQTQTQTLDSSRDHHFDNPPSLSHNGNQIRRENRANHGNHHSSTVLNAHPQSENQLRQNCSADKGIPDLTNLPKYPVPPGAKNSLRKAGLSQSQIDLLSALVAQHQAHLNSVKSQSHVTGPLPENTSFSVLPTIVSHNSSGLLNPRGNGNASILGSPASNYSSKYSNPSTMSIGGQSPYKEGSSGTISDANSTVPITGPDGNKRKRNTAASARFRIKKKMKEQEMELKIQRLGEMVKKFELRVNELEMENKFLKSLVIEKSNRASDEELNFLREKAKLFGPGDSKDLK